MKISFAAVVLAALPLLPTARAQEGLIEVPPEGREFRQDKLLSPNLTDVWRLDAAAGEEFWCTVETGAFDPVLECFDADGKRLGSDDGQGLRSSLRIRAEHQGPVEFRVAGFRSSGGGLYSFALVRRQTAVLAVDGEASHCFGRERWWHWRVPVARGDVVVPTVRGNGRLTAVFDDVRLPLVGWLGGYEAPRDGELLVGVEGDEGQTCQLTLRRARKLSLGTDGRLAAEVDRDGLDILRVPLRQGMAGTLAFACEQWQLPCDLRERQSTPIPAIRWNGQLDKAGNLRRWFYCVADTELLVGVRGLADRPLPYRCDLALASRELVAAAATAPLSGSLALGDGDLHHLELTAGQLVRIQMHSEALDARFDLWDPAGNVIARADDRTPLDRDAEHVWLAAQSGTFRVLTHADGRGAGAYTLAAEILPVPQLAFGDRLELQLASGAVGYARVLLQPGQEVWFNVRSRDFDAGLTIQAPDGETVFTADGGGSGGDVLAAFTATHGGVHTVLVHPRGGQGRGELRVIAP